MGRSQETFSKKEKEKKRQKRKEEKQLKKEERKANSGKGKTLEEMFAYVDENGNLTSKPPDPSKKIAIKAEDIRISISKQEISDPADLVRKGTVTFFNEAKGYGFIVDLESQERIFVHVNALEETVKESDKVSFETEQGPKGTSAINVKIIR